MRTLLLLSLAIAVQAKAESNIGSELLVCAQTTGGMKSQCRLETLSLASKQSYEKDFVVEYQYSCIGPATDFNLRAGDAADPLSTSFALKPLAFSSTAQKAKATITGFGPVDVYDSNPSRTFRRPFSKDCSIVILSVSPKPSTATIQGWQTDLDNLRTLLGSYKDNRDAFGALAILEPAFGVYDTFISNVLKDKVSNNDLVDDAKGLLACSDGTADDGCLTLMDNLVENYRAAKLTDSEGDKLRKLQKSLGAADLTGVLECKPEDTTCTPLELFLNKYLTADDRAALDAARQKLTIVKGSEAKYETYETLVIETENRIEILKATAGGTVK